MLRKIRYAIYDLIREDENERLSGRIFDGVIIFFILLNIVSLIVDTMLQAEWYIGLSSVLEVISVVIFSLEYLMRLVTSDLKAPGMNPVLAVLKHVFSFMALIDLFAILPFYMPAVFLADLRVLRALRIFRVLRLFKFGRYTLAFNVIGDTLKKKKHQLLSSLFVIFVLMTVSSVLMYNFEHEAQPSVFQNAFSGFWWSIATFTTVGYGDIYPITVGGKILASVMALLGIGLVAVPTGILSAGFIEYSGQQKEQENEHENEKRYCPYCGHSLEK